MSASPWAIAVGVATVGVSWAGFGRATAPEGAIVALAAWLGICLGACLSAATPIGLIFKRVSAWVAALTVFIVGVILLAISGLGSNFTGYLLVAAIATSAALDLRWATRLRVMVFLSGVGLVPILLYEPWVGLGWVMAWFAGLAVTQWLLTDDEHEAMLRPESAIPPTPGSTRKPLDLLRVFGFALAAATFLGLITSTPSCSFQPLAHWLPNLPWTPEPSEVDLEPGAHAVDYEVDGAGHEVGYQLDPRGRRFIVSPRSGVRYAVVERDGRDDVVDRTGNRLAQLVEIVGDGDSLAPGASVLTVEPTRSGDRPITYRRDDSGWYLTDVDGGRYYVILNGIQVGLVGTEDTWLDVDGDGLLSVEDDLPQFPDLGTPAMAVTLPDPAILQATTDGLVDVRRGDGIVEVTDSGGQRRYTLDDRLLVELRASDGTATYRFAEDRSYIDVFAGASEDELQGRVPIDRTGNALDPESEPEEEEGEPMSFSSAFRQAAIVILVLLAVGTAVWLVRRRRSTDDAPVDGRSWAANELARLESLGRSHGSRRRGSQSVIAYGKTLVDDVDEGLTRIHEAMAVIDLGLFGDQPVPEDERLRVSRLIDEVIEQRPVLDRRERRERDIARAEAAKEEEPQSVGS